MNLAPDGQILTDNIKYQMMNKRWIIAALCTLMAYGMHAQKLTFNKEGTFKIVQFTDIHYKDGNPKSDTALLLINRV